jgi:RPA family protein
MLVDVTGKAMCFRTHHNIMTIKQNEKFMRQPALRLFAAELAESKQTIIEHIEGRNFDSRFQLTPTGVKVKRVLMMGVLVEIDNVDTSGGYLRGRIVDPTGAFTVYAGQYQPEALRALSSFTIPCFVAVVGKTNAYRPDEKTTIVSIRPETIVEIDAKTRDYWVKETVAKTLERVERSQLPEVEKEKYKQICRNALTKLIYMPQETSIHLQETPKEPTPHQEEDIPANLTIEQSAIKDEQSDDTEVKEKILSLIMEVSNKVPQKVVSYIELVETARETLGIKEEIAIEAIKRLMNEGRCNEPKIGFLHPTVNEEKSPATLPASASEEYTEDCSMISTDAPPVRNDRDEEPRDKTLTISPISNAEEQPKPENEFSENLHLQESKKSKTQRNNPVKARKRKKKIEEEPVKKTQKALFSEASGEHV